MCTWRKRGEQKRREQNTAHPRLSQSLESKSSFIILHFFRYRNHVRFKWMHIARTVSTSVFRTILSVVDFGWLSSWPRFSKYQAIWCVFVWFYFFFFFSFYRKIWSGGNRKRTQQISWIVTTCLKFSSHLQSTCSNMQCAYSYSFSISRWSNVVSALMHIGYTIIINIITHSNGVHIALRFTMTGNKWSE